MNANLWYDLKYFFTKLWAWAVAICIAVVALIFGELDALTKGASVIEATTLIAAVFIAFNVLRRQRLDELDKKLTVEFKYEGKIVLRCENAYLAGVSDIRQWGQSIGQLMNGGNRLDFEPYIRESSKLDTYQGKQYRHFTASFTLQSIDKMSTTIRDLYVHGEYLLWVCALDGLSKEEKVGKHS